MSPVPAQWWTTILGDGDKDLVTVATGDGESLTATSNHPIWEVSSQTWIDAGDLWPGDILETVSGDQVPVVALTYQTVTTVVYNLTVEDIHTYHAGHNEILVHNCDILQPNTGIYEITTKSGNKYVGQSSNIDRRIAQHKNRDVFKRDPIESVKRTEVLGTKWDREVAEQLRIDELGGIGNLLNVRNAIGVARRPMMNEYLR